MVSEGQQHPTMTSLAQIGDGGGDEANNRAIITTPYHSVSDPAATIDNDRVVLTLPIEAKVGATFLLVVFVLINSFLISMEYGNDDWHLDGGFIEMAFFIVFIPLPIVVFIMTIRWKIYADSNHILYQHGLWFCCPHCATERLATQDIQYVKIVYQPMEKDNGFRTKYHTEVTVKLYTTKEEDVVTIEEAGITGVATSRKTTMRRADMEICHSDVTFLRPFITWLQVRGRDSQRSGYHHQFTLREETLPSMYIYQRE